MVTFTTDIFDQELDRIFRDNKEYISERIRSDEYDVLLDGQPFQVYGMQYILKNKEKINNERYKGATYKEVISSLLGRIANPNGMYYVEKNGDNYQIIPKLPENQILAFKAVQGRAKQKAYDDQLREKQRERDERIRAAEARRRAEEIANEVIKHQTKPWRPRKRGKGRRKRWTSPKQRLFEELKF